MSNDVGKRTREFDDFFTTDEESINMYNHYKHHLKDKPYINKLLEPSVGTGKLIWPALESDFNVEFTCCDIQLEYLEFLQQEAIRRGYDVYVRDDLLRISNVRG